MKTFKFRLPEHPELEQAIEDYAANAEDSSDYMYDVIQLGAFSAADAERLRTSTGFTDSRWLLTPTAYNTTTNRRR